MIGFTQLINPGVLQSRANMFIEWCEWTCAHITSISFIDQMIKQPCKDLSTSFCRPDSGTIPWPHHRQWTLAWGGAKSKPTGGFWIYAIFNMDWGKISSMSQVPIWKPTPVGSTRSGWQPSRALTRCFTSWSLTDSPSIRHDFWAEIHWGLVKMHALQVAHSTPHENDSGFHIYPPKSKQNCWNHSKLIFGRNLGPVHGHEIPFWGREYL